MNSMEGFKAMAQMAMADILHSIKGSKDLVVDKKLASALNHVTPLEFMQLNDVKNVHILSSSMPSMGNVTNIIYLIRPQPISVKLVAEHVKAIVKRVKENDEKRKRISSLNLFHFHVFILPQSNPVCRAIFEQEGVLEHIVFGNGFQFDFIPLDRDLISLEMEHSHPGDGLLFFRDVFLDGDLDYINHIVLSLRTIEDHFGEIGKWMGKGRVATIVCELYRLLQKDEKSWKSFKRDKKDGQTQGDDSKNRQIETAIIIDRTCDYVTPLTTPVLYEAAVDSVYKIEMGMTNASHKDLIDYAFVADNNESSGKILLNNMKSTDPVYEDLRVLDFREAHRRVTELLKAMKTLLSLDPSAAPKGGSDSPLSKVKQYLQEMGDYKTLHETLILHERISSLVIKNRKNTLNCDFRSVYQQEQMILKNEDPGKVFDLIEEMVLKQEPLYKTLRLYLLHNLANNGIKNKKSCLKFQRLFLQQYGFEHLMTFNNLDRLGIAGRCPLPCYGIEAGLMPYQTLRKKLKLVQQTVINPERKEKMKEVFKTHNPAFNGKKVVKDLWKQSVSEGDDGGKQKPSSRRGSFDSIDSEESEDENMCPMDIYYSIHKHKVDHHRPLSVAICEEALKCGSFTTVQECKSIDVDEETTKCNYNMNQRILYQNKCTMEHVSFVDEKILVGEMSKENLGILVYFVGGCTYEEVGYLRKMALEMNRPVTIATTGIIRQDTFMSQFVETVSQVFSRC
eukprot:Nk52_evm2s248 gene=Nk52_evmTU2s248